MVVTQPHLVSERLGSRHGPIFGSGFLLVQQLMAREAGLLSLGIEDLDSSSFGLAQSQSLWAFGQ